MTDREPMPLKSSNSCHQRSSRRVAIATLGCRLNLYETDALAARFQEGGYEVVDFDSPADVYVINSCTVTDRAARKSRNLVYRAVRRARAIDSAIGGGSHGDGGSPAPARTPLVILTGCHANNLHDRPDASTDTLVVPNQQKHALFDLAEAHRNDEVLESTGSVFDFPVPSRLLHTRTMLKIQDGCDNFCSFCIIPFVRGPAVSRPMDDVLTAAEKTIADGARELVLTGVNLSRYRDGGCGFPQLAERLLQLDGDFRVRFSSLEPDQLDHSCLELFEHPKMSPHLHLCLQSASDRILRAMRRQYTYRDFCSIVGNLRNRRPDVNLTTDVIVGFPSETDDEFLQTLRAVDDVEFGHVHTFPYSERSGTAAARLPGRLPERVRTERAAAVRDLAKKVKTRYRRRLVGTSQRLLVERVEKGAALPLLYGFGGHYVPIRAVCGRAEAPNSETRSGRLTQAELEKTWQNRFVDVYITGIGDGGDPHLLAKPAVCQ